MTRSLATLVLTGLTVLGSTALDPQTASAQSGFGVQLNLGPAAFSYQQGYPVVPPPVVAGPYTTVGPAYPVAVAPPVAVVPAPYAYPRAYYPRYYNSYQRGYYPYGRWDHRHYHR